MDRALIVVAKRPLPGQTKTRLCPPFSPEVACGLYECFLKDTLDLVRSLPNVARMIAYYPLGEESYFQHLAPDFGLLLQEGESLGERLDNALTHCLREGFRAVVIMDSDSPTLPGEQLTRAYNLLDEADVVLGPCEDGGYYLIGAKQPQTALLRGVRMSTSSVLQDTLCIASATGVSMALLSTCYDIDTVEDWERLKEELAASPDTLAVHTRQFARQMTLWQSNEESGEPREGRDGE